MFFWGVGVCFAVLLLLGGLVVLCRVWGGFGCCWVVGLVFFVFSGCLVGGICVVECGVMLFKGCGGFGFNFSVKLNLY